MSRQELIDKLESIQQKKQLTVKDMNWEEACRLRDIEKCISKILEDPLLNKAEIKVNAVNRERQMNSVLEDVSFQPYKIEETEEYKKLLEKHAIRVAKEELNR